MTRSFSWDQAILLWTLLLLMIGTSAQEEATVLDSPEEQSLDFGLVAWVNSMKGGYFNPKQEIRRENPHDPTSVVGVFAKERILKGELLNRVPWNAIIDPRKDNNELDDEFEDDEEDRDLVCKTARMVAKEMRLGKNSRFAPYALYLLNQPRGQLPSAWSPEGKALLSTLLGGTSSKPQIPPTDIASWLDEFWINECGGDNEDAFKAHACMLVVQRAADDDIMVPVFDLYNHRNGKYCNAKVRIKEGRTHELRASRTIEAGEQIHNSYNLCAACSGRYKGYGTAEIFRDYGFVERFPQRWHFQGFDLQFDVHEELSASSSRAVEYKIEWDRLLNPNGFPPKIIEQFVDKLRRDIYRLDRVHKYAMMREKWKNIPEKEWNLIWEYKEAVRRAYSVLIDELLDRKNDDRVPMESRKDCVESENCDTTRL